MGESPAWMSRWKLGSMVSKGRGYFTHLKMGYIGVVTHLIKLLLTSWDIQSVFVGFKYHHVGGLK